MLVWQPGRCAESDGTIYGIGTEGGHRAAVVARQRHMRAVADVSRTALDELGRVSASALDALLAAEALAMGEAVPNDTTTWDASRGVLLSTCRQHMELVTAFVASELNRLAMQPVMVEQELPAGAGLLPGMER